MADNPFKRADESGFLDNDPFAELMRMAEAPRTSQPEPQVAASENFDIDLEREMLGDFDEQDATHSAQATVADHWTQAPSDVASEPAGSAEEFYQPAAPADEFDDVAFDDLDLTLDLDTGEEEPHLPLSAVDEPAAPTMAVETEGDDVPDDFDARSHALFASVPEIDEGADDNEPIFEDFEHAFAEFGRDDARFLESDEHPAFQEAAVTDVTTDPSEVAAFGDFSDADEQTPDIEPFDLDLNIDEDDAPQTLADVVSSQAAAAEDFGFDLAARSDGGGAPDDAWQAEPAEDYSAHVASEDGGEIIGGAWSAADLQVEGPVEPVSVAQEQDVSTWREPELRRDVSDDDDILSDIENWLNADPLSASPMAATPEPVGSESFRDVEAFADTPARQQEPVAPQVLSLEDELGALLGDDEGSYAASSQAEHAPAASYSHEELGVDDLEFDLDLDDTALQPVAEEGSPEDLAEQPAAPKKTGPLAMLAALAPAAMARFGGGERTAAARTAEPVQPARPLFGMARTDRPVAPEIETVEVEEQPTALVDDLDIPELAQPEEVAPLFSPDDLEAELDVAFGSLAPEDETPGTTPASAPVAASFADALPLQATYNDGDYGYVNEPHSVQADDNLGDVDFDYEPDTEPLDTPPPKDGMRRKYFILGGVAAVALVGGFGYFMAGGPVGDGLPAIVRADSDPVRVRPENRGGAVVPNQDSRAYQRATGATGTAGGSQEELMTSVEEPLDVRSAVAPQPGNDFPMVGMDDIPMLDDAEAGAMLASVKNDERLGGVAETSEEEGISIAPRRVRTMVVRPDGTLVPRDEVPAAATREQLEANAALAAQDGANAPPRVEDAQPVGSIAATQDEVLPDDPVMPDTVGVVPSRPQARPEASGAAQAPVQVAAAQPPTTAPVAQSEAAAANTGEWSMQIASQPSAEGAQAAYQDLARRYASVLEGRGVNIVRAEIDGMGTFYRVRIQANTRDEAVQLCTQYKAAGGSCFVSR